jgi:hypothetical protein
MKSHTSPKDIFLQLFATAMLYLSIIAIFIVTFILTDWYIASSIDTYPRSIDQLGNMLSFPLAMLVVSFPLLIATTYKLHTRMGEDASIRNSMARGWLVNLTLFLAAIIIAITAITVVYTFFNGDLTLRTVIKSFIVVVISSLTIVWFKSGEDNRAKLDTSQYIVAGISLLLFVSVVVVGVIAMGSPAERRMLRQDQELRYRVQNAYYSIESSLYNAVEDTSLPGEIYAAEDVVYTRLTDNSATLCATFQTEYDPTKDTYYSKPMPMPVGEGKRRLVQPDWSHTAGETCFTITLE